MRVIIQMKNNVIQRVSSDEDIDLFVIDYDVEDLDDDSLVGFPEGQAFIYHEKKSAQSEAINEKFVEWETAVATKKIRNLFN